MALVQSDRKTMTDMKFDADVDHETYSNILFQRLVAKQVRFSGVDFKYNIFDTCYLRNCIFDSCDFTGCRFVGTNFHGSQFTGCKFDYSHFERTYIDSDVLDSNAPSVENLKERFARSLRMNYQSLGDSISVNKAIMLELSATREHLFKASFSNESYYRKKYRDLDRAKQILKWVQFKLLDFIWGNGESILKLARTFGVLWIFMGINDVFLHGNPLDLGDYFESCLSMPGLFLGTVKMEYYSEVYISIVALIRLVFVSLFISIIVKRFNRR